MKSSDEGTIIGPTESEGSIADATRVKDLLDASEELRIVARDLSLFEPRMAYFIGKEAQKLRGQTH